MTKEAAAQLYVVISDHNGWRQTQECLRKLRSSACQEFQVIVVDHGTTGETEQGMAGIPDMLRIPAGAELWWTGATNVGIRKALDLGAAQVMLLNNDCFVNRDTISRLLSHGSATDKQIVAPLQRNAEGEVEVARTASCFALGFPSFALPHMNRVPHGAKHLLKTRMIVGGRGVLIPAEVFDAVGLFDEDALPHYGADHDFYMRCRARGISLYIAPDATVVIDTTRTTLARGLGTMSWFEFRQSLSSPRSHRNVKMLLTLFKRYYPIRFLYPVGVALNLMRYFASYVVARTVRLMRQ